MSSHALESSHRTYLNKILSYPLELKDGYLGDTFVPSMFDEKVVKMKVSCPQMWYERICGFDLTGIALLGWVLNNYTCATTLLDYGLESMSVVCLL